ncbi:twin-arginine translocation signal domain-containing protein [Granulicella sp. S190]|uniref:twin-arginine translocation signal domain-containing protein n=1 Tax=Granulicella sp. S190 TaxID=1747226 RepID=UPI00131D4BD7|nr:twin-arginine translocation signal domain-containing protein [Granulicella sp. S190]
MKRQSISQSGSLNRRSFMRGGLVTGGAAVMGAGLLGHTQQARAQDYRGGGRIDRGDVAILRFLAAAELIEADLWTQYAELGGLTPGQKPVEDTPNFTPMNTYQNALMNLDGDGPQYITSNTLDEVSHAEFLNAYLESKGAEPVNLDQFRTLQGSKAKGAANIGRLTNLMHLNVDTSWFTRYRSTTNPDQGATFPQVVTINNRSAIPVTNADFNNPNHIQVIANIAAFHFGAIEAGGSSLYASLSQKVSSAEVLEITLGIGGDEIAHFLEWVDFAGNGCQPTVAPVSDEGLTFPNLFATPGTPEFQPNLIFPVPAEFISPNLPKCATIRPLTNQFAGPKAAVASLTGSGLFTGQSNGFLATLQILADEAEAANRSF